MCKITFITDDTNNEAGVCLRACVRANICAITIIVICSCGKSCGYSIQVY